LPEEPDREELMGKEADVAMQEAIAALKKAMETRFYGEITFSFKDGELAVIRTTETVLPKNSPLRRNQHEHAYQK
jgi:hypothetical protein